MAYTAFSYSRIKDFELCPRRFHESNIKKSVPRDTSPAMEEGKRVHKSLELRVSQNLALPPDLAPLEPMMAAISATKGVKRCELQMAINGNFEPVDWFSKAVYSRAVADLVIDAGRKAALFDYKTGKKQEDFLQLRLTAVHYFHYAPQVEEIKCAFIWTKDGTSSPTVVKREELADVWAEIAPRVATYQQAFETNDFPARQSWACRRCPVKWCEHNQAKT